MLHSTKSTNFSQMYYFFMTDKMVWRADWLKGCSLETQE